MTRRFAWLMLLPCALAQGADDAQREQLKRERQAIEARHAQQEQACRAQFVVTPCLDQARADKQQALQAVQSQEVALDEAERRERADAQEKRLAEKAEAARQRDASPPAASASRPAPVKKAPQPSRAAKPPAAKASAPDRSTDEKRKRAEFEARKREIQAHREEVEKRNAERAASKPAPKPLPLPASGVK